MVRKSKDKKSALHLGFWFITIVILTLIFGHSWGSVAHAFYFITLLLPVVIGTSYFFNFFLVPRFLLTKRYFWFTLYFIYLLIFSLYLEMMVLAFSFMNFARFEIKLLTPNSKDTLLLAIVLYLIVFCGSFLLMVQQLLKNKHELELIKEENSLHTNPFLVLLSNRKTVKISYNDIVYIESLADYIKVHTIDKKEITSKEKISVIENNMPSFLIRIHRSFIVNRNKVTGFSGNEVELGETILPLGRIYKQKGLARLTS